MIHNKEKLNGCVPEVITLVSFLDSVYQNATVNSGLRSEEYNRKVGGAKNSAHITGEACDISVPNVSVIKVAAKILDNYLKYRIKGMGIDVYKNYVHIDFKDRGKDEITYWSYNKYGQVS